jgi:hypothetical protein
MLLFAFAILALGTGLWLLWPDLGPSLDWSSGKRERAALARASAVLRELEETLSAGLLPEASRWERLKDLDEPWGRLAHESLSELRSRGGSLLPTLKRLRELADRQLRDLIEGRARSANALAQALTCAGMVPLFAVALIYLLPGLAERRALWIGLSASAMGWAGIGALWLLRMAESARWAGLRRAERPGLLSAYCASERLLALIRSGLPPDLAWAQAIEAFRHESAAVASRWGSSVWAPAPPSGTASSALDALGRAGEAIRKAIQCALMEGRPSSERIEAAMAGLRHEIESAVERELGLLSTRALKPLFLCVAPALMGLLAAAVLLTWQDSNGFL